MPANVPCAIYLFAHIDLIVLSKLVAPNGSQPYPLHADIKSVLNSVMLIRNGIDTWRRKQKGETWIVWFFIGYLLATLGSLVFYFSVIQHLIAST